MMSSQLRDIKDTPSCTMRRNIPFNDSTTSLDHYPIEREDISRSIGESAPCSQSSSTKTSDKFQPTARPTMPSHAHKNGHNNSNKIGSAMLRALCDPHGVGQLPRNNVPGEKLGLEKGKKVDAAGQDTGQINFDEKLNELLSGAEPTDDDIDRFLKEAQDEELNQHTLSVTIVAGDEAACSSPTSPPKKDDEPLPENTCGELSGGPANESPKAGIEHGHYSSDEEMHLGYTKNQDAKAGGRGTQQTTVDTKTQETTIHQSQSSNSQSRAGVQSVVGNHRKSNIRDLFPLIDRLLGIVISIYDTFLVQTVLALIMELFVILHGLLRALSTVLLPVDLSQPVLTVLEADIPDRRPLFEMFSKLPVELRLMIWEHELPDEPRVVEIERGSDKNWYSPPGSPRLVCGLMYANLESRAVFLSHYKKICGPRAPILTRHTNPTYWQSLLNFLSLRSRPRSSGIVASPPVFYDPGKDSLYIGPSTRKIPNFGYSDFTPSLWTRYSPGKPVYGSSVILGDIFQNLHSLTICQEDIYSFTHSDVESHEEFHRVFPNLKVLTIVIGDFESGRTNPAVFPRRGKVEVAEEFLEVVDYDGSWATVIRDLYAAEIPWPIEFKGIARGGRLRA